MDFESIPGLAHVLIFSHDEEIAYVDDSPLPKRFTGLFSFYENTKRVKIWGLRFQIYISENGTPVLWKVEVEGSFEPERQNLRLTQDFVMKEPDRFKPSNNQKLQTLKTKKQMTEGERLGMVGVERWQLKVLEQNRFNLLELAVRLAITNTKKVSEKGVTWWRLEDRGYNANEISKIKKSVERKLRQKIKPEFLKKVAEIYTQAEIKGEPPIQALQSHFNLKAHRTAQDYAHRARKAGFLPETSPGKITIKKPTKKKGEASGKSKRTK